MAPPWQNTMWCESGIASRDRRFASASPITSSNQGLRCDTSSGEAPIPGQRHQVALDLLQDGEREGGRSCGEVDDTVVHG